jgi:hypothetical protein
VRSSVRRPTRGGTRLSELGALTRSDLGADEGDELELVKAHHLQLVLTWSLLYRGPLQLQ